MITLRFEKHAHKPQNMQRITLILSLFLFFSSPVLRVQAQNPASIDVNKLSDQQIQQIVDEINAKGLTIDQAAAMAQMRGATPDQIDQIKRRIQELSFSSGKSIGNPAAQTVQTTTVSREAFSQKVAVTATPEVKRIFGYQLFNSENLTFEPPVNIPTPQNYILGIDDELSISVWGASQNTYQLKIETNGAINIPDIGPVYVAGMDFSKAKDLIKKRLISIYHGMEGSNPNTFAEVSISNLRSIKINVIGEALAPGTYMLPSTASVFNALYLSGGPSKNGSFRNIEVIRDNKTIKTIDVYDYLINAKTEQNIPLREQDIIYIPTYQKRIEVSGAFKRTGIFELTENEKLSDLLRYVGGFTPEAYQSMLSLTRITGTEKKVIDINQSIFDSFIPKNGDSIVASAIIDRYENRVNIAGAVFRPGTYELTDGLTLSSLIKKAGGVKEDYFSNRGVIIRLKKDLEPMTLSFDVAEVLNGTNDITLQREDQVVIQDIFSMRQKQIVRIFGEVQKPGEFVFTGNMTLKDLIFNAGGFTEAASESYIELARRHSYQQASEPGNEIVKLYQFQIDRGLKLENKADTFHLEPFDYIYVRQAPAYYTQRTVYINGEVKYPGAYSISSQNERVSDLIRRAGGLLPNAYIQGARMTRTNQIAIQNLAAVQNNTADTTLRAAQRQIKNDQLELNLSAIIDRAGSDFDYLLKDGDQITIPEVSQEVRINGEIQNPIGQAYQKGKKLNYYINRAGGFSEKAKKSKTFVIYSDGTTKVTRTFLGHTYPKVAPGCQIVVPQKPEKQKTDNTGKWLAIASTITTILVAITRL